MKNVPEIKLKLKPAYEEHRHELNAAIQSVLDGGQYILGEEVNAFETEFSRFIGVSQGIGVASGTDALVLSLKACGIKHGDEVITVPFTSVATAIVIQSCGAKPFFIDIDDSCTIDINKLETFLKRNISKKTKAILPVHLYGYAVDMEAITSLAKQYGLWVIEDACQAHGALFNKRRVGSWGDIAAFSFYPTKNLGAFGDAGMVVTNDAQLSEKIRALRQYGWKTKNISESMGINSRMDDIQAAVLRVKLKYLDQDNQRRIKLAEVYHQGLEDSPVIRPSIFADLRHIYHQYAIRSSDRDGLKEFLAKHGIVTQILYPLPIHLQPAYRGKFDSFGGLETSEKTAREILSLPIYPQMGKEEAQIVIETINHWFPKE
ncbi:MAG: DegT/DnrJ/EryC1/StrS family aminotransferase [Anaerolineales bacterium]|nr:DegT/DnrJ/EryC1/StrS family aminotransferase [Anaerolineales bacterium]